MIGKAEIKTVENLAAGEAYKAMFGPILGSGSSVERTSISASAVSYHWVFSRVQKNLNKPTATNILMTYELLAKHHIHKIIDMEDNHAGCLWTTADAYNYKLNDERMKWKATKF